MKGKIINISIFGILVGRILNRILDNYFHENGSLALLFTIVALFSGYDLYLLIRGRLFAALATFILVFPLLIGFIGMYIDNYTILGFGICSIFIVYPLFTKWMNTLDIPNKSDLWNHKGFWW